ncbi:polyprotein [grusopivirus C1]|uniref:Polyprotein n=1 Tax=grusopivirus C1 TaxID=2870377 RepID=A0AC61LP38_9PICO|nr:polyprotein [grusopivirus C1]QCF41176.1 polyprotein [grusopivirus C1]
MQMETIAKEVTSEVTSVLSTAVETMVEEVPGLGKTLNHQSDNAIMTTEDPTIAVAPLKSTSGSADDYYSCSYVVDAGESNVQKMILLETGQITTNKDPYTLVTQLRFPQCFFDHSSKPAQGQSQYFDLVRCGCHIKLCVHATAGSLGGLVLQFLPPGFENYQEHSLSYDKKPTYDPDTMLYAPTAILDISRNSEVSITVPYVHFQNYADFRLSRTYGQINVYMLTKASLSNNAVNHIPYAIFGELLDLDFQCPRFFKNQGRKVLPKRRDPQPPKGHKDVNHVLVQPGYGALNMSNAVAVDRAESLSLCNDTSGVDFRTAGAKASIISVREVARRWTIYHFFDITESMTTGETVEVVPLQLNKGIFKYLADSFAYFKGSLEIKLMVFASTFHKGKIQMTWYPRTCPAAKGDVTYPYTRNGIFITQDMTSVGPILTLPFTSTTWRRSMVKYGSITINVVNPLTRNGNCTPTVHCVLMLRAGPDFTVMVPSFGSQKWVAPPCVDFQDDFTLLKEERRLLGVYTPEEELTDQGNEEVVENPWDSEEPVPFLNFERKEIATLSDDHADLSNCLGRMTFVTSLRPSSSDHFVFKKLPMPAGGVQRLSRGFAYFSGEIIIGVHNQSSKSAMVTHSYWERTKFTHWDQLCTSGAIIIPPGESKVFKCPFYSEEPLRPTNVNEALGYVHAYVVDEQIDIFVSLRHVDFFFIMPLPKSEATIAVKDQQEKRKSNSKQTGDLFLCGMEDQGLGCGEMKATHKRPECLHSLEQHRSCHRHYFIPRCCKCQEWEFKKYIEAPGLCMEPFKEIRPKFYCVCKKGIHHFQCEDHYGRQMCCGCAHTHGWLDEFERQYFEERSPHPTQKELGQFGVETNPGPHHSCKMDGIWISCLPHSWCDKKNVIHQNCQKHVWADVSMCCLCSHHQRENNSNYSERDAKHLSRYGIEMNPGPVLTTRESVAHFTATVLNPCDKRKPQMIRVKQKPKCAEMEYHFCCEDHVSLSRELCCVCTRWSPTMQSELGKYGIEKNPGPTLVCKDRGLYKHYGVQIGDVILHVSTENVLDAIISGEAKILEDQDVMGWQAVSDEYITVAEKYIQAGSMPNFKFNVDNNCETWARHLLGDYGPTQGEILKRRLVQCVALGMLAQFAMSSQGLGDTIQGLMTKLTDLIFGNLENQIVKLVVRAVVRILCYLILYIHSPNLMTTGVLAALLVLDATSISVDDPLKVMTKALINGDFSEFCAAVLEKCDTVDSEALMETIPTFTTFVNQGLNDESPNPKPFNDWTTCAKNVQWWLDGIIKAFKWIKEKLFPTELSSLAKWMEENEDNIATTIALADEHLVLLKTDKEYATSSQTRKKHLALCDTISGMMIKMKDDPRLFQMINRLNTLLGKLQSINFEPEAEWTHRPEPLGIWINGAPGVGKSFLTNFITKRLKEKYNWKVYANATGSNHMDGYTDQEVHVFDDFGQQREETDYTLMCNLISSVPFIVPKAEVTAKGTTYKGRAVLVTTNRRDFTSVALFDAEALERRFPFKYQVRPKPKYELNGKLNVALAMRDGMLLTGNAWERNLGIAGLDKWEPLDGDTLMEEICTELMIRENIAKFMNQGNGDQLFAILEQSKLDFDWQSFEEQAAMFTRKPPKSKIQKFKSWVTESVNKIKSFVDKNRTWFIAMGAVGSIISVCSFLVPRLNLFSQSFYEGGVKVGKLAKNFKVEAARHNAKFDDQGLLDLRHICQRLVNLEGPHGEATALALGNKTVITYGHEEFTKLTYVKDTAMECELKEAVHVQVSGEPTDLAMYECKTSFQFKSASHLIYDQDYRGKGYLIWKHHGEYMLLAVDNIRPAHPITTTQGTISSRVYMYNAKTGSGTCGGVLVGIVNGNPKILGIHTSGNGVTGAANRLYSFFNQGKVVKKEIEPRPKYFQPRKSAYVKSPVYQDSDVGPPVLSKNDKRLEVEVDDVTVRAAEKYVGNTFDPPPTIFEHAKIRLAENLSKVLEYKPKMLTYEEATSTDILDIDWTTSPGEKYKGKTKKELIAMPDFKQDVIDQLENPNTYFVTYLKDELRSSDKIKSGNTRAIEACNFDYTIAFRMVMGNHYRNIMDDVEQLSEICVGINPYVYFDTIVESLNEYNLCLDYKKFDGSLSPQVMEAAVEVFSWFARDPDMVRKIHHPTIYSTNWVSNQVWTVDGGMCSGSPCTSVLNSAVNVLVLSTMMMSYGYDPKEIRLLTYGDDCVISVPYKVDVSDFKWRLKNYFGMTVTNFDKTEEFKWLGRGEISFLKRTPTILDGTTKLVGALDLSSMKEKIQWTRSLNDFSSQLESFQLELALHGKEIYEREIQELRKLSPGSAWMPFKVALQRMKGVCDIL